MKTFVIYKCFTEGVLQRVEDILYIQFECYWLNQRDNLSAGQSQLGLCEKEKEIFATEQVGCAWQHCMLWELQENCKSNRALCETECGRLEGTNSCWLSWGVGSFVKCMYDRYCVEGCLGRMESIVLYGKHFCVEGLVVWIVVVWTSVHQRSQYCVVCYMMWTVVLWRFVLCCMKESVIWKDLCGLFGFRYCVITAMVWVELLCEDQSQHY